jgi:DNA-binding CsgD family transcriptional regulator
VGNERSRGPVGLTAPSGLTAHSFVLDAEEFVLLAFPLPAPLPGAVAEADLTPSERAVLSLLESGAKSAEIARARQTSPRTVTNQIAAIYRKLGVSSRRELLALVHGKSRT